MYFTHECVCVSLCPSLIVSAMTTVIICVDHLPQTHKSWAHAASASKPSLYSAGKQDIVNKVTAFKAKGTVSGDHLVMRIYNTLSPLPMRALCAFSQPHTEYSTPQIPSVMYFNSSHTVHNIKSHLEID